MSGVYPGRSKVTAMEERQQDEQQEQADSSGEVVAEPDTTKPERDEHGRYLPGFSGNLAGRPVERVSLVRLIREVGEANGEAQARKVVENLYKTALGSGRDSVAAAKLIIDRVDGLPSIKIEGQGGAIFLDKVFVGVNPVLAAEGVLSVVEVDYDEDDEPELLPEAEPDLPTTVERLQHEYRERESDVSVDVSSPISSTGPDMRVQWV